MILGCDGLAVLVLLSKNSVYVPAGLAGPSSSTTASRLKAVPAAASRGIMEHVCWPTPA